MPDYSSDVAYWDSVAHLKDDKHPGMILVHSNAQKVRIILSEIFKHDMHEKTVVEIGTGSGVIAGVVQKAYMGEWEYLGTDISGNFLSTATNVNKLKVVMARSTALPVKDDIADFVFMFDVFEHIHPDERVQTAKEITRVLKKGGILIMNSPMLESQHEQYDYDLSAKDGITILNDGQMELIKRKVISYGCAHDPFRMYLYEEFRKV